MSARPKLSRSEHALTRSTSYEALPENFSLGANMWAGAFAGIAVRHRFLIAKLARGRWTDGSIIGTLCDVPHRPSQGKSKVTRRLMHLLTAPRHGCKSSTLHPLQYTPACPMPFPQYQERKARDHCGEVSRVS